ncbi:MAG: sulfatase [Clostridia bacterium]
MRTLFLDLDTLRADHLGCYGYTRNTSPNIDKIASKAVRFTNYFCSDAPCLPSRSALMSGRFGIHTGVVGHGGSAADQVVEGENRGFKTKYANSCLPNIFRENGCKTALVSPFPERHSAFWFYAGFNEMFNTGKSGGENADEIAPAAISWIRQNAKKDDWYLHINFWDAHTPYRVPMSYGNPFENDDIPEFYTEEILENHKKMAGIHKPYEMNMYDDKVNKENKRYPGRVTDMKLLKQLIDGYDTGIRYMDDYIGILLDELNGQGVSLDELNIIVTADHAENMGELGIYGEHATADVGTCKIPMIIKWQGGKEGSVDDNLHYNLDLCPTISELYGKAPKANWDGISYANAIVNTGKEDKKNEYLVISQMAHVAQRSVIWSNWLYIRTYHDGHSLFNKNMLFNLDNDPYEQKDVAEKYPEIASKMASLLLDWQDAMMETSATKVDPLYTVMREGGPSHARGELDHYLEFLTETDRNSLAEILKNRTHPYGRE